MHTKCSKGKQHNVIFSIQTWSPLDIQVIDLASNVNTAHSFGHQECMQLARFSHHVWYIASSYVESNIGSLEKRASSYIFVKIQNKYIRYT